jgi:glutamate-1-semialdehyde aminotransferase
MFISSTYWSDAIGLAAALTTVRELRRRNVSAYLHRLGTQLQQRLNAVADETELAVRCTGLSVHPTLQFAAHDPITKRKLTTLYIQEMAKRGCHGYTSFYLNAAQGADEIEQTIAAAREVFGLLADAWRRDALDTLLEADLTQDAFRRMVR